MCYNMIDFILIVLNFLGPFLMSSKIGRYIMCIHIIILLLVLFYWLFAHRDETWLSKHICLCINFKGVYIKHVNALLVKTSEALLQMKWLLGTRWSVLRVIYHFMELDGSLHSCDEHKVRMEFHTMGNIWGNLDLWRWKGYRCTESR